MNTCQSNRPLDNAMWWEKNYPDRKYLVQPLPNGSVVEYTWGQVFAEARKMASYLQSQNYEKGSHIAILSKNCAHWIIADLAIWLAGYVSIPLFPTLNAKTVAAILEHSESKLLIVGKLDTWNEMRSGVPSSLPTVCMPLGPVEDKSLKHWDDVIKDCKLVSEDTVRELDEIATIIYTSGSTGAPKGVMMSFGAMADAVHGNIKVIKSRPEDRMLSYLPLAHVMERWLVEQSSFVVGFTVYFANTLDTFIEDLQRATPTLFVSVPRLWQKFQAGVSAKMPEKKLNLLLKIPILGGIVRNKVLTQLGLQNVRIAGTGSAPIPPQTVGWYRNLGLELLEAYGMTENFCYSHISLPGQTRLGYVGNCYPDGDCRINDQGEIEVKSPGSMSGYYKEPEMSKDAFTADGYLKTGDRGEIDQQGRLKITGRTKELFKTSKGKYVAPAPIENQLNLSEHIEISCVSGSGYPQPFGLVVLSEELRDQVKNGQADRQEVSSHLKSHMSEVNAENDHHEHLKFLTIVKESWLIENGFLTPTMKIKRAAIEDRYLKSVDAWFGQKDSIIWES